MRERLDSIVAFLKTGIWFLPEKGLSGPKALSLKALKVLLLSFREFKRDQCAVRASALAFYSLLSVVPVVAVVFGIAKGFGFDKKLQAELLVKFSEQSDVLMRVFELSDSILVKTSGGIVAGIGIALLFWAVVNILGSIEDAFNHIWKVGKARTIGRKCSDYLSFAMVCPLILIMSSSLTVTIAGQVEYFAEQASRWGVPPQAFLVFLEIIPFLLIWGLFAFLFIFMPNTKVRLGPGIAAAVAAGTAYQLFQWVYITFQVGVTRANAVYGSFAALPLFLIWVEISWLIVLVGSEISFAVQNLDTLGFPETPEKISPRHRKILAVLVARLVARNFSAGEKPLSSAALAHALGAPSPLVLRILEDFSAAGLISAVISEGDEEDVWQPARDIHGMTVTNVLDALDRSGSAEPSFTLTDEFRAVSNMLDSFAEAVEASPANRLLLDLRIPDVEGG